MKRITYLAMAISSALVVVMLVGPAVPGQRAARETLLDRHHLLYGLVIPPPTDAPHAAPGELYVCLACHAIDTSSGINKFVVERDCQVCHSTDRHHPLYDDVISDPTDAPHAEPGELYVCLACHAIDTSSGRIQFPVERDCRVCHQPPGVVDVEVNITPFAEDNPVNLKSKGILSVSILGSLNYDVTDIDTSSVLLEGLVAPVYAKFLTRPHGRTDLTLNFAIEDVSRVVGLVPVGQTYDVWITGILKEGTPISGSDFILSAGKGHGRGKKGRESAFTRARAMARLNTYAKAYAKANAKAAAARADASAFARAYARARVKDDEQDDDQRRRHRPRRKRLRPRQVREAE